MTPELGLIDGLQRENARLNEKIKMLEEDYQREFKLADKYIRLHREKIDQLDELTKQLEHLKVNPPVMDEQFVLIEVTHGQKRVLGVAPKLEQTDAFIAESLAWYGYDALHTPLTTTQRTPFLWKVQITEDPYADVYWFVQRVVKMEAVETNGPGKQIVYTAIQPSPAKLGS